MRELEFYAINFMPYPFIPPGEEIESSWVVLPNSYYDPQIGHSLYEEYLEINIAAEKLGFDGILHRTSTTRPPTGRCRPEPPGCADRRAHRPDPDRRHRQHRCTRT